MPEFLSSLTSCASGPQTNDEYDRGADTVNVDQTAVLTTVSLFLQWVVDGQFILAAAEII